MCQRRCQSPHDLEPLYHSSEVGSSVIIIHLTMKRWRCRRSDWPRVHLAIKWQSQNFLTVPCCISKIKSKIELLFCLPLLSYSQSS